MYGSRETASVGYSLKFTQLIFEEGVLYDTLSPLTLARKTGPTRLTLSQMLSAPDQVLFQKKLTNFQKLLFIYTKSIKNGYHRSKKPKLFY
jgi:hypothetical protein